MKFSEKPQFLWRMFSFTGRLAMLKNIEKTLRKHKGFSRSTLLVARKFEAVRYELSLAIKSDIEAVRSMDKETFEEKFNGNTR
jgi:hypothetical protein